MKAFYEEIAQHRIPVEREVVALLVNGPGMLELYVWLVWRTWTLNGPCVSYSSLRQRRPISATRLPEIIPPTVSFDERFDAGFAKSKPFGQAVLRASPKTATI